jgi:hypothetical protein
MVQEAHLKKFFSLFVLTTFILKLDFQMLNHYKRFFEPWNPWNGPDLLIFSDGRYVRAVCRLFQSSTAPRYLLSLNVNKAGPFQGLHGTRSPPVNAFLVKISII